MGRQVLESVWRNGRWQEEYVEGCSARDPLARGRTHKRDWMERLVRSASASCLMRLGLDTTPRLRLS